MFLLVRQDIWQMDMHRWPTEIIRADCKGAKPHLLTRFAFSSLFNSFTEANPQTHIAHCVSYWRGRGSSGQQS